VPIHDLGYRAWQGRLLPEAARFWVITQTGLRLAWQNRWLRRLLLVAWMPAIYMGVAFFFFEQSMAYPEMRRSAAEFLGNFPEYRQLFGAPTAPLDAAQMRHKVWAWLLLTFFRYPQGVIMALVVGLIAPPLIARDVRSRAFLLYFSRPLTRLEYVVGKMAVVWGYLLLITTLPALVLYVVAVLFSPELSVVNSTWDLPLRILGASLVLVVPTTALALAFSSLTSEIRYAGFAWFALWGLGWVTYGVLTASLPASEVADRWTLVSLYHTLGKVEGWVFGLGSSAGSVVPAAVVLAAITAISLAVLFHRVSSPMRI
jgi:hypothetical protein